MGLKGKKVYINTKGQLVGGINHSCDPNCRVEQWVVAGYARLMVFAEGDISATEELTIDYHTVMPKNTPAKGRDDKDGNLVDCLCGSEICRKPKFKRHLEPNRQIRPKRYAKPSPNGSDPRVQSVQSPMQPSPEHKQTSCGKDSAHETASPGIVGGVEQRISTDNEGTDNERKTWCICSGEYDGALMIECSQVDCKYKWLHALCVGRTTEPRREKWYCPSCTIRCDHSDEDTDND